MIDRATNEPFYPCSTCGLLRTKAEGGAVFTVCDGCWDAQVAVRAKLAKPQRCIGCGTHVIDAAVCEDCWDKRHSSLGEKLLAATREQLIEEVLRLRGELADCQRKASP